MSMDFLWSACPNLGLIACKLRLCTVLSAGIVAGMPSVSGAGVEVTSGPFDVDRFRVFDFLAGAVCVCGKIEQILCQFWTFEFFSPKKQ